MHLDSKGLVALWRETLLAQKVLLGETKGYRNHPQLDRFKKHVDPLDAIACYLQEVWREADRRGYRFDASKILRTGTTTKICVTTGQVAYELSHLKSKLKVRDQAAYGRLEHFEQPALHPLFAPIEGEIEDWEVV